MINFREHLINKEATVKDALAQFNRLAKDAIVFIVDQNDKLLGSLTDGDVRRGLLKDLSINSSVMDFTQSNPKYLIKGDYSIDEVIELRNDNYKIIPVLDSMEKSVM